MLQVPVTADEIRAVPKTAELRRQQDLTMAAELRFWQECLMDGAFGRVAWGPVIPVNALYEIYREWAARASNARVLDKTEFGRRIALFATREKGSKVKRSGSGTERCWVLRTLEEAREVFDREMGTSGEWPDVDVSPSNTIPF
jgi:phage/plasmid-associated DNA primase